jgi:hypothetical protein
MKKPKQFLQKIFALMFVFVIAVIIYSCKRDTQSVKNVEISDPLIFQAKNWYESNYPTNGSPLSTQSVNHEADFSQFIKPDWKRGRTYKRFDDDVIEMPLDASLSAKMAVGLKSDASGEPGYNASLSTSSFLLLKQMGKYNGYIMTLIADPAYIKGDLSKLSRNNYNKRDSDYSGVVIYSTPNGKFVNGWVYKDGILASKISTEATLTGGSGTENKTSVQSVKTDKIITITTCKEWYQTVSFNGVTYEPTYLGRTCTTATVDDGTGSGGSGGGTVPGGGGSGSGSSTVNVPCVTGSQNVSAAPKITINGIKVNYVPPPPPIDGGGGYPPPSGSIPCPTATTSNYTNNDDKNDAGKVVSTDCNSFAFTKTSTANWQEAGVRQIRLKWVWIGGNNSGMSRTVYIPSVVYGLPTQYQNANGSITILTPGAAASRAAQITEAAKVFTYQEFRNSPYYPTDAEVMQYFKNQLAALMASQMGTAGATGTGSGGIIFREEDRSDFFPYNCD